jgi:hypothetical protein
MQILAILVRSAGRADSDFAPYRVPEERRVWALIKSAVIRRIWSRADRPGALLLLEAADAAEARETVKSLPMVREGLVDFELMELAPFLALENLFGPQAREG